MGYDPAGGALLYGSPVAVGNANADGIATTVARSDHVHLAAMPRFHFGTAGTGTAGANRWVPDTSTAALSASDTRRQIVPRACTLRQMFGRLQVAGTDSAGTMVWTYTVQKNGINTALVININNTSTAQVSNVVNSVAFAAGDEIGILQTGAGGTASAQAQFLTIDISAEPQ